MSDSPVPQQAKPLNEVYGLFAGNIDQAAVARIGNAAAIASSNNVTHVHLAIQTLGGSVSDGIALFNIFRQFPTPLTLYNIGSVSSAGVVAFLGAPNRLASPLSTFMIHRTVSPPFGANTERLNSIARSVVLDDERIEAAFSAAGLKITEEQRAIHRVADLWFSADESVAANISTAVGEFAPPKGTQLFFVGSL